MKASYLIAASYDGGAVLGEDTLEETVDGAVDDAGDDALLDAIKALA